MSAISQKSISGITSITTPAGVDNQFTVHTNNTSEALKLDHAGNIHIHNHINTTGISSASNFKTGSSNLHSTGLTVGDSFVHSTGFNVGSNIKLGTTGVITATSFVGDGSDLTNLPAGLGTALSATASSPLNKMYYTNQVLGVPSSVTVDVPASASKAYTQYADIKVESSADLIIAEGDDLIPDVLGLADFGTFGGGATAGRIRVNSISNAANDGSPTVQKGLVVTGVTTSTTFSGSGASLTNLNGSNIASGTVPVARIGTGTKSTSTFYRGDGTFATVTSTTINNNANNRLITGSGTANTLEGEANIRFDGATLTVDGTTTDTPLILTSTNVSGSHMRFQKDGSNKHFVGSGGGFGLGDVDDLSLRTVDNIIFGVGTSEKVRIDSGGRIGVGGISPSNYSSGANNLVISAASGSNAGITIDNASGGTDSGAIFFSHGTGANAVGRIRYYHSDDHMDFYTANSERLRITSDGDVAIGRDAALNNYAAGSTTTQLAVVKDGGAAGSGYHEVAHFTAGTDTNDTGAIVRITQFNNDRGLYIKGGRGTSDQAKAIFGLRNSSNSDSDVMIFEQGGRVTIPGQPSFAAYKATNSYTQSGVIVFDATRHNIGSHYNTSNGRFTAPVAGRYQFTFYSIIKGNYSNAYYSIQINGAAGNGMYVHVSENIGNLWEGECTTWILSLSAGDYVDINSNSSINWHGNNWQLFSGHLLG